MNNPQTKLYELTLINKPDKDDYESVVGTIKQYANIVKAEDEGVKHLAYDINGYDTGHYYFFELEIKDGDSAKLCRELGISEPVNRYLLVTVDMRKREALKALKNK